VTRRAALFVLALAVFAVSSPLVAPYEPGRAFREYLHAPPMRPQLSGGVHPLVLADRLEQRYESDPTRTVPLPWFGGSSDTPVFLLGSDSFGRDVFSRLLYGARTSISLALMATLGAVVLLFIYRMLRRPAHV